jgi:hypothetical protein
MKNLKQSAACWLAALVPVLAAAACAEQPTPVAPEGASPDRPRDGLKPAHVRAGASGTVTFSARSAGSQSDTVVMELGLCPVPPDCN